MFPRAATSSASVTTLSIKFTLSGFFCIFLDCPLCFCFLFASCSFLWLELRNCLDQLYFPPHWQFVNRCFLFFFPQTSSHVLIHVPFRYFQCRSITCGPRQEDRLMCPICCPMWGWMSLFSLCLSVIPHYILRSSSRLCAISLISTFVVSALDCDLRLCSSV